MTTNWPSSVSVSVNNNPLNLQRGDSKTSHKALLLKNVCKPGRNTIQINVIVCCCVSSHFEIFDVEHFVSLAQFIIGLSVFIDVTDKAMSYLGRYFIFCLSSCMIFIFSPTCLFCNLFIVHL